MVDLIMRDNRYTLRRANPYHTLRNRVRPVRTPGNRIVAHYLTKRVNPRLCAETKTPLHGIPMLKTEQLRRMKKSKRTVSRPYGGVFCASVVKDRIITAFMDEEASAAEAKQAEKAAKIEKADKTKKGRKGK